MSNNACSQRAKQENRKQPFHRAPFTLFAGSSLKGLEPEIERIMEKHKADMEDIERGHHVGRWLGSLGWNVKQSIVAVFEPPARRAVEDPPVLLSSVSLVRWLRSTS